jgi:hypothetical protein
MQSSTYALQNSAGDPGYRGVVSRITSHRDRRTLTWVEQRFSAAVKALLSHMGFNPCGQVLEGLLKCRQCVGHS